MDSDTADAPMMQASSSANAKNTAGALPKYFSMPAETAPASTKFPNSGWPANVWAVNAMKDLSEPTVLDSYGQVNLTCIAVKCIFISSWEDR